MRIPRVNWISCLPYNYILIILILFNNLFLLSLWAKYYFKKWKERKKIHFWFSDGGWSVISLLFHVYLSCLVLMNWEQLSFSCYFSNECMSVRKGHDAHFHCIPSVWVRLIMQQQCTNKLLSEALKSKKDQNKTPKHYNKVAALVLNATFLHALTASSPS